ncbi:MAG: YicC family protein [Ignavibacteria bacterium]|nr:YicC family protein [Ignavibacteria bacterium]
MILSMTGFGKALSTYKGYAFESEVKSLNSRYLEITIKLPSLLQNKEYEIREALKNLLRRGKIYISLSIRPEENENETFFLNESKLKELLGVFGRIKSDYGVAGEVKLDHIINFRDIFTPELDELDDDHIEHLKLVVIEAVKQLNQMREAEGGALAKDLSERIRLIDGYLADVEKDYSGKVAEYFSELKRRVIEITENSNINPDRIEYEIAMIADKADITEECVRLRSHLNFFLETLEKENEAGKKLNFICQEMHREANTLASKSLSTEAIHKSVQIRDEIERIREQVQNIE